MPYSLLNYVPATAASPFVIASVSMLLRLITIVMFDVQRIDMLHGELKQIVN